MKYNVNFSEIVAQLVKVFKSEQMTRDYNIDGEMFEGVCGWCGVMAPLSREAFIKAFGASVVLMAETKAREEIQAAQERHNATQYHAHTIEADELQGVPAVGGFFWAANSGLKCDDGRGVFGEISALLWRTEEDDEHSRREFAKRPAFLCQVREVFTVSPDEFNRPELADELVTRHALQGGSASDDIDEGTTWQQLANDEEARATLYTFGALVTDGVRYYLIDSEGYSYSRYIYVPLSWRDNLGGIVKSERERIQARKEAEAKQEEEEKAARLAEYKSRCNKWAHLMEDVRPLEKKEAEAFEAYTRTGWKSKSPEGKAHTAAKRATDAARKRNILAMCSAAFPGVKFSVSVHRGWGEDFRVTWQDGPTEAEFNEVADLDLFASSWDTFDGMTDCADVAHAEFTDFSALTMGDRCGGSVKADREISEQTRAAVIAELVAVVPEYDSRDKFGYHRVTVTEEQAAAVAQRLGVSASILYACGYSIAYDANADEIAHRYCWHTSFYKKQDTPTDPEPNRPKKGGKVQDVANDNAPADGLELVEIAGGVAVVGDTRTTYRNRKEIKAHGAKWNKNAQRWEGTEPEAVAALRAWFGASDDEHTTNNTGEPSEGKQKPENVTRSQLLQVVAVARWFGSVEWSTAGTLRDCDTIETDGNDPEAVTLWHRFGRPLNRRACVEIFGEDVTAEGETLHTMADHSAHYTEDGDTFAEWWQAVAEISDQERAPRTESGELSEVAKSEAVASGAPRYRACENSPIFENIEIVSAILKGAKSQADSCGEFSDIYNALRYLAHGADMATDGAHADKFADVLADIDTLEALHHAGKLDSKGTRKRWQVDRQLFALCREVLAPECFAILYPSELSTLDYYSFPGQAEVREYIREQKDDEPEPQPTAPTEGGKAEDVATSDPCSKPTETAESSVIWHDMELTEHEAEHAENILTLLSRGVACLFITDEGAQFKAEPTANGCTYTTPHGTTYGETLEDVAAMMSKETANDPAGRFDVEQPTNQAPEADTMGAPAEGQEVAESEAVASGAPRYSVCEKSPIFENLETSEPSRLPSDYTTHESPAELQFIVELTCNTATGETSREFHEVADSFGIIEQMAESAESVREVYDGFHGYTFRTFDGSVWHEYFATILPDGTRPEYMVEREELKRLEVHGLQLRLKKDIEAA